MTKARADAAPERRGPPREHAPRLVLCGTLVALSGALFWRALLIEGGAYPLVATGGAALTCGAYLLGRARRGGWPVAGGVAPQRRTLPRVAAFAALWAAYVLALPPLGFILATWIALAASVALTRARLRSPDLLWTAAFVGTLAVLMKVVLYVPVPQGWLDERLELLIYSLR